MLRSDTHTSAIVNLILSPGATIILGLSFGPMLPYKIYM